VTVMPTETGSTGCAVYRRRYLRHVQSAGQSSA
jgi:hypothetical protein